MSSLHELMYLMEYEQLLNSYSGKRYHFRKNDNQSVCLVEVIKIGQEKIIIDNLTDDQMYNWLKRHIKVTLKEDKKVDINER